VDQDLRYVGLAKAVTFEAAQVSESNQDFGLTHGYYSVNHEFINGLPKVVTVVDRDGVRVEIPPSTNPMVNDFIIRVKLEIGREVNLNIDNLLNSSSPGAAILVELVQRGDQIHRHGKRKFSLDYHITLDDIESRGGSVYLNNLDRVVSTLQGNFVPHHPYSDIAVRNQLVENDPNINDVASFGYSLRIVDSHNHYGDRYVNINNQVYKVPVVTSSSMPDGVYLTSSGTVEGNYQYARPVSKRYSFEEADDALRLYKTVEDAKTFGDVIAEKEKELKELSVKLKEREQRLREEKMERESEFERFKQQIAREQAEEDAQRKAEESRATQRMSRLKEEIAELEHQRTVEMLKRKDTYESRSLERKDSSEMVKFLPAVVTGALALFVAFSKFSS